MDFSLYEAVLLHSANTTRFVLIPHSSSSGYQFQLNIAWHISRLEADLEIQSNCIRLASVAALLQLGSSST